MGDKRYLLILLTVLGLPLSSGCERVESDSAKPTVEFAAFQGGLGIDFFDQCVQEYSQRKLGNGTLINFWYSPRMESQVEPRILRRNPPDLAYGPLPFWQLVVAHRLVALDQWLDEPSFDQPGKTWRETFVTGALEPYRWRGRTYAIPFGMGTSLFWYDKKLWREHNWKVPETWEELVAVCRQIKSEGLAPVAFQGKYWGYAQGMFESILYGLNGPGFFAEVDEMKPGVFRDERYIEAARRMQQFAADYFEPGCMAMTHTEAQLEFLRHRAAMVWCGTYFRNEMKEYISSDIELSGFPWPRMRPDVPQSVELDASVLVVFADGRSPNRAIEFLRFMTSLEQARRFVELTGSPSAIGGAANEVGTTSDLHYTIHLIESSPALRSARLFQIFPALQLPFDALFGDLLKGRITPGDFGAKMELAAEQVRNEPAARRLNQLLHLEKSS